jgi:hypothetical protein
LFELLSGMRAGGGQNTHLISVPSSTALGNWIRLEGKYLFPSREPPLIPEYYAVCHFPETMSNVVDTDNPIQGMFESCSYDEFQEKGSEIERI